MSAPVQPVRPAGIRPGAGFRWARRLAQLVGIYALLVAPLLGGWQRLDRSEMANWDAGGYDLHRTLRADLPLGDVPARVHEENRLKGGGTAAEYLGIPLADPLTGTLSLIAAPGTSRTLIAIALPVLLALFAGRVFCGWFCPFGTLSRWLDWGLDILPFRRRIALPKQRPLRYALLLLCVGAGFVGSHLWLYLSLPYLLLQQGVYAGWLLGGGGAVLGLLAGLLLAGLLFGPNTYCATLCPTGASLALLGRGRRVHVTLQEPKDCGSHCVLCSRNCWLQLDPASGDPGPDCDSCGRCFPVCPQTNMVMTTQKPRRKLPVVSAAMLLVGAVVAPAQVQARPQAERKPDLVLDVERTIGDVTVALSAVDLTDVQLGIYDVQPVSVEISAYLARGATGEPDADGLLASRPIYKGPLTLQVHRRDGGGKFAGLERPNHPASTQKASIYRQVFDMQLEPGDRVVIAPIPGWLPDGASWEVPHRGTSLDRWQFLGFALAGFLIFAGLLSAALAVGRSPQQG